MSVDNKVPAIRFKGFSEVWANRKMSDCSSKIGDGLHGTPKYTDNTGIYFINGNNLVSGSILITDETKQVSIEEKSKNDNSLDFNTLLLSINGTIGNLAWYQGQHIMLGKSVAFIKLENCNNSYMYAYMQTERIKNYFLNSLTGSTIKNLGLKAIRESTVVIPDEHKEQIAIGNYFQKLDSLINQHQQKHDKLSSIKKAMLEKMFPKQGETIPEIRFEGFSGEWEEISLLDSIEQIIDFRGRTPKKLGLDWSSSGYRALSALNVKQGYIDFSIDPHFGDQELYDKWMSGSELHQGQVLFTTEAPMGNVAQVPNTDKYILSQRTIAFITKSETIAEDFLAVLLRSSKVFRELSALSSGGTAKGVSQKVLANLIVSIPTDLIEQTAIGNYFQKLDSLINQHQQQITKLNNIKQACLSKMFV